MGQLLFQDLTDVYEAMIDWPKRLAREGPFFRRWLARAGAKSVLDAACGTGRHAAMFHEWGLRVEGADLSPKMIERARAAFGEPDGLRWTVRGFDQATGPPGAFDAAVCLGNSLALAPDLATVAEAVRQMLRSLRRGGSLIIQVLNLWHLPDGPCVWQKCLRTAEGAHRDVTASSGASCTRRTRAPQVTPGPQIAVPPQGDVLVLKGVHRGGSQGHVDLIVVGHDKIVHHESVPFLGMEPELLEQTMLKAGAGRVSRFGNYDEQPFDRQASADLIVVAEK